MPTLTVVESQDAASIDKVMPLLRMNVTIGRVHGNTIKLSDTEASRMHAAIHQEPQGWWIEDLKSANGTIVNGETVDRAWLKSGDRIQIGSTVFEFREEPETVPVHLAPSPTSPEPPPAPGLQAAVMQRGGSFRTPWLIGSIAAVIFVGVVAAFIGLSVSRNVDQSATEDLAATAVEIDSHRAEETTSRQDATAEIAGDPDSERYAITLNINAADETCESSSPNDAFLRFKISLTCDVAADGSLAFTHAWQDEDSGYPVSHRIQGSGTFVADQLHIDGQFHSETEAETDASHIHRVQNGTFQANGEREMGAWFERDFSGSFETSVLQRFCTEFDGTQCAKWETTSTDCAGELTHELCSIESFTKLSP